MTSPETTEIPRHSRVLRETRGVPARPLPPDMVDAGEPAEEDYSIRPERTRIAAVFSGTGMEGEVSRHAQRERIRGEIRHGKASLADSAFYHRELMGEGV